MISIVIPLYKVEPYIINCLNSLEKQYERDFEVIIVNDGTPDNSAKLVEAFQKKSKLNIKLVNQENRGVSAARNCGIEHINGDYVCFVDSDDMLDRNYLSILKNEVEQSKSDICICRSRTIGENEDTLFDYVGQYGSCVCSKEQALEKFLYKDVSAGIWALMCKREILGSLKFAENYHYSEDLEMVWKLVATAQKINFIDAPLYCYRIRKGSAMSVMNEKRIDGMKLFDALTLFIRDNAPNFYSQYEQYGVASWIWSTLWQEAKAARSYKEFADRANAYSPCDYLKRLYTYKKRLVALSSFLFVNFRRLYYIAIRIYKTNYRDMEY